MAGRRAWLTGNRALAYTQSGSLDHSRKGAHANPHPFPGSIQQYAEAISDPDRYRPDHCPQCEGKQPLTGHGFYSRTLADPAFDGVIRVRRYLSRLCKRTVSLLPEFALPWLRFSITVISLFLVRACFMALPSRRPHGPPANRPCPISAGSS